MTPLDDEGGLRPRAEKAFAACRQRIVCPACHAAGAFSLSSSKKKRRFQCRCNKSWSCSTLLGDVLGKQGELMASAQGVVAGKRPMRPGMSSASSSSSASEDEDDPGLGLPLDPTIDYRALRLENASLRQLVEALKKQVAELHISMQRLLAGSPNQDPISSPTASQPGSPPAAPISPATPPAAPSATPPARPRPSSAAAAAAAPVPAAPVPAAAATTAAARPATLAQKISLTLAKSTLPDKDKSGFEAALRAIRNMKPRTPPTPTGLDADTRHRLRRVYVSGMAFMKLGELKKYLYALRFKLSKIVNLDYVSKTTVEFLVYEDYADALKKHVRFVCLSVVHLPDPSAPLDLKASEAVRAAVRKAFLDRLARRADPEHTERASVRAFYADWLASVSRSPSSPPSDSLSSTPSLSSSSPSSSAPSSSALPSSALSPLHVSTDNGEAAPVC